MLRAYRERVCQQAQRLLDAEMSVAQGCSFLYRKPKTAPKGEPRKAELVTDEATIRAYLNGELDSDDTEWFFITTERPDTLTIRNMLDRTFDKPAQRVEVAGDQEKPLIPAGATLAFVASIIPGSENRT